MNNGSQRPSRPQSAPQEQAPRRPVTGSRPQAPNAQSRPQSAQGRPVQPQPQGRPAGAPQAQRIRPETGAQDRQKRLSEAEQRRINEEKQRRLAEDRKKAEERKRAAEKKAKRKKKRDELRDRILSAFSKENDAESDAAKPSYTKLILKEALAYFVVFLCLLLIICTGAATIFLWNMLNYGEKPQAPSSVTFTAGEKDYNYKYSDIVRDGVYYVNFNTVAKLCELSEGGDENIIIYSAPNGEQLRFTPPSRNVLINGNAVLAEGDIILSEGSERRVWVPLSLVRDYFSGLDITVEEKINEKSGEPSVTITASRIAEGRGFADISFTLKFNSVLSGISNDSLPEEPVTLPPDAPVYEFSANLSRYLQYMCPADYNKHMLLINPSHIVDATYVPDELVGVPNPRYDNEMSLSKDAAMSLEALFLEMHTLGFKDMKVSVAYRTFEQQQTQFSIYTFDERYYYAYNYETTGKWFSDKAYEVLGKSYLEEKYISQGKTSLTADDAKRVAMSYSAYPGTSDHQSGLGLDLYLPGYSGTKFAESDEYKWLAENAHKFGFIFRYPEGKENITGYSFEPYHLRFVGQYHAAIIYESGLTLDEYVDKYIN